MATDRRTVTNRRKDIRMDGRTDEKPQNGRRRGIQKRPGLLTTSSTSQDGHSMSQLIAPNISRDRRQLANLHPPVASHPQNIKQPDVSSRPETSSARRETGAQSGPWDRRLAAAG